MKTLDEYFAANLDVDINAAKENLNDLLTARTHVDCASDEAPCKLCLLEQLLKDYRTYFESRNEVN